MSFFSVSNHSQVVTYNVFAYLFHRYLLHGYYLGSIVFYAGSTKVNQVIPGVSSKFK